MPLQFPLSFSSSTPPTLLLRNFRIIAFLRGREGRGAGACISLVYSDSRFAACKGSAAEFVAPITMRHRLPFAHYAAPYAAVLACKSADECSEFCDQAGLCTA